jgi:hypothetical protein
MNGRAQEINQYPHDEMANEGILASVGNGSSVTCVIIRIRGLNLFNKFSINYWTE